MTINWIKCSERMPPPNDDMFIIRQDGNNKYCSIRSGFAYNAFARNMHKYDWTPYTEQAWKGLNKS